MTTAPDTAQDMAPDMTPDPGSVDLPDVRAASGIVDDRGDCADELAERVRQAHDARTSLAILGGGTKRATGRQFSGDPLDVTRHNGIVSYEPAELVLTARAGTRLADVTAVLAAAGQMLAFEPPAFGAGATVGGTVACGISGPRRPWGGAVRDAVLGVELINGAGERLKFGGQVMKNVAGYDVSRLMAGARGVLGVMTQVSVKVLPMPEVETTCVLTLDQDAALARVVAWNRSALPLSATCHVDGQLFVRLSGAAAAVQEAAVGIGGEQVAASDDFWSAAREQRMAFFDANEAGDCAGGLWRFSLPHAARMPCFAGDWLVEWAGAQRWLRACAPVGGAATSAGAPAAGAEFVAAAAALGGHVQRWRPQWWEPQLGGPQRELQTRLQAAFDPRGIFNPGR